jgi:fructuronate reductase
LLTLSIKKKVKMSDLLVKAEFDDADVLCTVKRTYIAPFVNTEIPQYLVIEDSFPNGRMPLEHAGVHFTDRETVNKVERMKVATCLNPLHSAGHLRMVQISAWLG